MTEHDEETTAALEQANLAASPTARVTSVEAAYWTSVGAKEHLRWVLPDSERPLMDALARLHVTGADGIADGSKLVGMFRANGLIAPVWDLPAGTGAVVLEEPLAALEQRLAAALGDDSDLTSEQRFVRSELANKQVTLR